MGECSKRRVLIYGKTGSGKSTLANMLVFGRLNEQGFATGNSIQGVTNECNTIQGDEYEVTDTVGLGEDTDTDRGNAKRMIVQFLKRTKGSYHHIIFVKGAGRQDKLDTALWKIFLKIFKEKKKKSNEKDGYRGMVLVLTGCPNPDSWLEANKGDLESNYKEVKERFVAVDFPPKGDDSEMEIYLSRKRSLHLMRLKGSLDKFYRDNGENSFEPRYRRLNDVELEEFAEKLLIHIYSIARVTGVAIQLVLQALFFVGLLAI